MGAHRITGWLASGGQGVVYLGQGPDGRPVAVKVLHGIVAGERFAALTEAARRVEPPGVARVLDAAWGRLSYIVSEYVEGPSLAEVGRLGGGQLRHLAVGTATGLAAVHRAGLTHGDLKPSGVLLGRDGARLVGFGTAGTGPGSGRAGAGTGPGQGADGGAVAYMAPEQLDGGSAGAAADVFAWASVMVFAATGRPPFGDDAPPAVAGRILRGEPQLGELPDPLREIVRACLAKDPQARPPMTTVLPLLLGEPHPATAPGPHPTGPHPTGPHAGGTFPGGGQAGGGHPAGLPSGGPVAGGAAAGSAAAGSAAAGGAAAGGAAAGGAGGAPGSGKAVGRRSPVLVLGAGAVAVCVAAGVVVWNSGKRQADAEVRSAQEAVRTSATARPSRHGTAAPRPTRTPQRRAARPRPTPTGSPERSTPSPTPTGTASFALAYVRVQGASKINSAGVACYTGALTFAAGVDATRTGAAFSYQWLYDGRVVERGTSRLPAGSRGGSVSSRRLVTPAGGRHTVAYRILSPSPRTKSVTFTMCTP
ncbi:serine/threonine-protein kinase [Nonomuraea sp. NPDC049607]|uniref:serine/threonine-protein kinase n=1 Tax=Nonomuraea sp. NPDC049607 TaxID=3154732 RepID=UPI00341BBF9B